MCDLRGWANGFSELCELGVVRGGMADPFPKYIVWAVASAAFMSGMAGVGVTDGIGLTSSKVAFADGLNVTIENPTAGLVFVHMVPLHARVSDPTAQEATLVLDSLAYRVPVELGVIRQDLIVPPGNNRVAVVVHHNGRTARDSLTLFNNSEPVEMVVLLTWPSLGETLDLWVQEPNGEICNSDQCLTESGGRLLNPGSTMGLGSQAYFGSRAEVGTFRLKVHYSGASWDVRHFSDYDRLIRQLDELQRERVSATASRQRVIDSRIQEIERELDRWSLPTTAQTNVRAEVILFPGRPLERRWNFEVTMNQVGQFLELGEVEISEQMLGTNRVEVSVGP